MTMVTAVGSDIRQRAAEALETLGWPSTRIEQWRYTNLAPLQKVAWRADETPALLTGFVMRRAEPNP